MGAGLPRDRVFVQAAKPPRKLLPGKTRAFIDFVVERFAEQGLAQRFDALQR